MVGVTGLEPAASCSQSRRATNCATPRFIYYITQAEKRQEKFAEILIFLISANFLYTQQLFWGILAQVFITVFGNRNQIFNPHTKLTF